MGKFHLQVTSWANLGHFKLEVLAMSPSASVSQVAAVVRPLRIAGETACAVARAAGVLNDDGDRSTTSFVASTDCGSGSTADSVSEL
jgi:hypothetical protein